jgi:hypothetical protein
MGPVMHAVQDRLRENFSVRSFADRSKRLSRSQRFLAYRRHIVKQLSMSGLVYVSSHPRLEIPI